MTRDEIIKYMIERKVIFAVGDEFFPVTKSFIIENEAVKKKQAKDTSKWAKNLPEKYKNVAIKVAYSELVRDSNIPTWSNGSLKFLLPTQTLKSEKALSKVLKDVEVDFNQLTASLKNYYNSGPNAAKKPLAALLETGAWKYVYDDPVGAGEKPENTTWK